ncbi:MAG TPA: hypothetical protein VK504_25660 [Vicinamibacterales bacterium]|nr:hypothetical protein [Vicinamibacterales bacterium]
MRTALEDPAPVPPGSALAGFSLFIESEPVQRGGIHLAVVIAHDGGAAVDIINPLDFLATGVMLLDAEGAPIDLPPAVTRTKINTRSTALHLPFRLDFVESANPEAMTMHFQPRDELHIGITIDKVGGGSPLPPGEYGVEILLRIATSDAKQTRTFESATHQFKVT